jgi:hypothetical protein
LRRRIEQQRTAKAILIAENRNDKPDESLRPNVKRLAKKAGMEIARADLQTLRYLSAPSDPCDA